MIRSTKLAAALVGGLLLAAAYTPAWAGSVNDTSAAGTSSAAAGTDRSLVGVLSPLLNVSAPHQAQKTCKADSLYSQHSVIGDPDACLINRIDARTSATGIGVGGVF
jgi:hypothetical protein